LIPSVFTNWFYYVNVVWAFGAATALISHTDVFWAPHSIMIVSLRISYTWVNVVGAARHCIVSITLMTRTICIKTKWVCVFSEPVEVTSPVGASFNSVIRETWVCWAVIAITINSDRINGTSMIRTTFDSIVHVTHMEVAEAMCISIHIPVFGIWIMETSTVITKWIIYTRTSRFNDSLGFSFSTHRWFGFNGSSPTSTL
jgi:hypothetical protein